MKKILLFLLTFTLLSTTFSQTITADAAKKIVTKHVDAIGLTKDMQANYLVSAAYKTDNIEYIYLQQTFKGLPVRNQMKVLSFKNGTLSSNSGDFVGNVAQLINGSGATPVLTAKEAVYTAFAYEKLIKPSLENNFLPEINKFDFGQPSSVSEKVTGELMWYPIMNKGNIISLNLVWTVIVAPKGKDDIWQIMVDATNGKVLDKFNFTVFETFDKKNKSPHNTEIYKQIETAKANQPIDLLAGSPLSVDNANYLVIPYPAESPIHPGGTPAVRSNPWVVAGTAAPLGWHSNGTTDYTITRGNNVWATEDQAGTNTNNGPAATSTTASPNLTFNFPPVFTTDPRNTAFQQFASTNLFYWNNIVHDITHKYGFTEPAGNFQVNNNGNGGLGNDDVRALCQSGAAGSIGNNANFGTPPDGSRPQMRMYLFNAVSSTTLLVNTPTSTAGTYNALEGSYSTANLLSNVGPVTAQVIYFNDDAAGTTHFACGPAVNTLTGKIALINRGTCPFTAKVLAAQAAGAIAVIMVNNVAGAPIVMGGTDNTITIPSLMISQADGAIFAAQLGNNLNVTMSATAGVVLDGDLDNGVVVHEFGHGISNRLTGGPGNASCLQNAEEGGEGWSDYFGLMLTTNWATTAITDGNNSRPIGNYVLGLPAATGGGIRNYPYTTNIAVNPLTYANMGVGTIGTEVHNIGEIWCAAVWEMTWAIIQQEGAINPDLYNFNSTTNGGNSIALKLVMEGLKLQPCSPGYVDARNAILAADRNLYCGKHACAIWTAFAKRGLGFGANQGSSFSATDQTASTILPPAPTVGTQPLDVSVVVGTTATFTANAGADVNLIYQWQVSTNGGTTWTDIPCAITATLTLTNVTTAMNGNKYRANVYMGCAITPTIAGLLTVTSTVTLPVITTQPSNSSVCAGADATFVSGASGGASNVYSWQVSTNGGGTWAAVTPTAATTTLTLTAITVTMNNNQYRMVVTNTLGTATSNAVTLTVTAAPTVTAPANATICAGVNTSFTASVTGGTSYKWQLSTNGGTTFTDVPNAAPYSNVTTTTLNITTATIALNNNQYRLVASAGTCSTNSTAAILTVNTATAIATTGQPANTSICTNGTNTASFSVTATGTGLTYQWYSSPTGIAGSFVLIPTATSATYTTGVVTVSTNGFYQVIVSGTCGAAVTSNTAQLLISVVPSVSLVTTSQTVCAPVTATYTCTAAGTAITYQWQYATVAGGTYNPVVGGTGANTNTYTTGATNSTMNGWVYRVVITGSCTPAATSAVGTLTVNTAASVTGISADVTVCNGSTASCTVTATGTGSTYQWKFATTLAGPYNSIVGANTASYTTIPTTPAMNGYYYRAYVTTTICAKIDSSAPAKLTVNTVAVIGTQPTAQSACIPQTATFNVAATGTGLTYQWQVAQSGSSTFTDIPLATGASYTTPATVLTMNGNQYRVNILSTCSPTTATTSSTAILTVNNPVVITQQPTQQSGCTNDNYTFSVLASSPGNVLSYQWQISPSGNPGTFENIGNATTASYTINNAPLFLSGSYYRVYISVPCGTGTSSDTSAKAKLLLINKPAIVLTKPATSNTNPFVNSSLFATVSPVANTASPVANYVYTWTVNGAAISNATASIPLNVDANGLYKVTLKDMLTGCTVSDEISVSALTSDNLLIGKVFTYPNPVSNTLIVRFNTSNNTSRGTMLNIYDEKGARVFSKAYSIVGTNGRMEVDMSGLQLGTYIVYIMDASGNKLGSTKVVKVQ